MKPYSKWMGTVCFVTCVLAAGALRAGNLDPTGTPGPTMYTLEDIYLAVTGDSNVVNTTSGDVVEGEILNDKKAWVKGNEVTGTMPNVGQTNMTPSTSAQTIPQGYHDGTGAVAGDANLVAGNIKTNVTLFGMTGTHADPIPYPSPVPKTGQTTSYRTGDDGNLKRGLTWPSPRFTVHAAPNADCVTDNLTGLVWARNADIDGAKTFTEALAYCEGLTYGGYSDWRLPNAKELLSLIDIGRLDPPLPSGHPFLGVKSLLWWSSSTYGANAAWYVSMASGSLGSQNVPSALYVWPVRGGQ